ncbi:MAG: CHAD domain-containing protein [Rhodoferax sp.]|nr:CHAD domain-containing protein [Rhodoferax sp.]
MTKPPSTPREVHRETELKLALPERQVSVFERLMARRRSAALHQQLLARYFDTPDFALSRWGVAVRLRRVGRRWLQTLKTGGERGGGLSQREEFEMPVARNALDWARFPPEALVHVPEALRAQLVPVFETHFKRTAWQVRGQAGARIEVALDVGEIQAGARTLPLCEVELELKSGSPDALFALALGWTDHADGERLNWLPLDASKAERGVRLAHDERAAPVPVAPVPLSGDGSVEDSFVTLCTACLAQFQANLPGVLHEEDIEYLHQARVALQRLRTVLRLYRRLYPLPEDLLAGLRALASALGPARDWDVLCSATLPAIAPGFDNPLAWQQLAQAMESRRLAARQAMRGAIAQAQPAVWLLTFHRWLMQPALQGLPAEPAPLAPLQAWAGRALRAGHKKIVRSARDFAQQSPQQRHVLRLLVKRQRYVAEFFEALYPAKRHAGYLRRLRELQSGLGRANDAHIARALLAGALEGDPGAGLKASGAICFAQGWLARQAQEPVEPAIPQGLKDLKKRRPSRLRG